MKKVIESILYKTNNYLDIEWNTQGFITLKIEDDGKCGVDLSKKEWEIIKKDINKLFKQI